MTKPLHAGKAGANGVQAAFLARAGFTADANIIEAPLGFAKVMGHNGEVDWAKAGTNLGKTFVIAGPVGLAIKPYPSCGFTHAAIDCALDLRQQGVKTEEIVEIEFGHEPLCKQLSHPSSAQDRLGMGKQPLQSKQRHWLQEPIIPRGQPGAEDAFDESMKGRRVTRGPVGP